MPRLPAALALSAAAALGASPAWAGTVWLCGLSDNLTRIVCVADQPPAEADEPQPTTARVRGTPGAYVNATCAPHKAAGVCMR